MNTFDESHESLERPTGEWVRRVGGGLGWVVVVGAAGFVAASGVALFGAWWSGHHLAPVKVGMTMAEVGRVAGEPGAVVPGGRGGVCWSYTRWWSADAEVHFDAAGRVGAVVTD